MTPVAHTGFQDSSATGCTAGPGGGGITPNCHQSELPDLLSSHDSFYRQVVESTHEGVWGIDLEGTSVYVNQRMAEMLGCTVPSIVGRSVFQFVFEEERSAVRERLEGYLKEPLGTRGQQRLRRADGSELWTLVSASVFYGLDQKPAGILGMFTDISDHKMAEEALQQREQELSDFFADAPLGLMWVAPGGQIQRVNQAQLAILGCSGEAVFGQPITQFHAEPSEATELLRRLSRGELIQQRRSRLRRPDGGFREILIDANGLWDGGTLVHSRWFVRDITQNLSLEREVLEISERERQRIAQNLHDDLCQQLVGIEFLCQRLVSRLTPDGPARAEAAEISLMVKSALAQGRELAHGLSRVSVQPGGLAEELRRLTARTRHVFQVDCRFRNPGKPMVRDSLVAGNIYQMAREAITNALKHGKARRIEVRLTRNRNGLRLCVKDDGVGLRPGSARNAGTGISIMRHRAETMSGSLQVDSSPGHGTRVTCLVPESIAFASRQTLCPARKNI